MKIGIICSEGGHLVEALNVLDAFKGHKMFLVTFGRRSLPLNLRNIGISKVYTIGYSKSKWIILGRLFTFGLWDIFKIILKEKPDVLFSTGAEIAIPAFVIGKIRGSKLIFLETLAKFNSPSGTGKVLYRLCDKFIVPWKELSRVYGKKAEFFGEVI